MDSKHLITNEEYEQYTADHWYFPPLSELQAELAYTAMCLGGEVGEVQDAIKKLLRHQYNADDVLLELGDALHYLVRLTNLLGYSLDMVMQANIDKLDKRFAKNPEWLKERS